VLSALLAAFATTGFQLLRVANSRSNGTSAYHPPFWILIFRRGCVALESNLRRSVVANRAFCDD
jgi:hypothetical protein